MLLCGISCVENSILLTFFFLFFFFKLHEYLCQLGHSSFLLLACASSWLTPLWSLLQSLNAKLGRSCIMCAFKVSATLSFLKRTASSRAVKPHLYSKHQNSKHQYMFLYTMTFITISQSHLIRKKIVKPFSQHQRFSLVSEFSLTKTPQIFMTYLLNTVL